MSDKFGLEVCRALGLDEKIVCAIRIEIEAGQPTLVEVKMNIIDGDSIDEIVNHYTLASMELH